MVTSIPSLGDVLSASGASAAPSAAGTKPADFGKDTFLKLLVAQLKYQNPLNPVDGTQFIAQTAQFTMVEKLDELAQQNSELVTNQRVLGAAGLIGRSVDYLSDDGSTATGTVTGASFGAAGAALKVTAGSGVVDVPLARVREVAAPQPSAKS